MKRIRTFVLFRNFVSEEGVTLVISIVMLGTLTFISFGLSTVILREIPASRLILTSEPAFAGANAGAEASLYLVQRNLGSAQVTNSPLQQSGATFDATPTLTDNPYNFSVPANQTVTVNLYQADDPNAADPGYR